VERARLPVTSRVNWRGAPSSRHARARELRAVELRPARRCREYPLDVSDLLIGLEIGNDMTSAANAVAFDGFNAP
jgi:hypothetical protein